MQQGCIRRFLPPADLDQDIPSLGGEFEGVTDQVGQHLAQAQGIADQGDGDVGIDLEHDLDPLVLRYLAGEVRQVVQDLLQVEVHPLHGQLAGFDLGKVEDVVDDAEQRLRGAMDLLHVVALLGVELGLQGQVGHADDGVHRRADLVAHVGQEIALGAGRLLGQGAGLFHRGDGRPLLGDVLDHAGEALAQVLAVDGLGGHAAPEAAAVLAHQFPILAIVALLAQGGGDGLADLGIGRLVGIPAPGALTEHLPGAIAEQQLHHAIAADDLAVPHQHDAGGGGVEDRLLLVMGLAQGPLLGGQGLLGALQLGDAVLQARGALLDALGHGVEGHRQVTDLVAGGQGQPSPIVATGQGQGILLQFAQGQEQPAPHQPIKKDRHADLEADQGQDQRHDRLAPGVDPPHLPVDTVFQRGHEGLDRRHDALLGGMVFRSMKQPAGEGQVRLTHQGELPRGILELTLDGVKGDGLQAGQVVGDLLGPDQVRPLLGGEAQFPHARFQGIGLPRLVQVGDPRGDLIPEEGTIVPWPGPLAVPDRQNGQKVILIARVRGGRVGPREARQVIGGLLQLVRQPEGGAGALGEGHERLLVPQEQANGDPHGAEQDQVDQGDEPQQVTDGETSRPAPG